MSCLTNLQTTLDPSLTHVVTMKYPCAVGFGDKSQMTVLGCCNASHICHNWWIEFTAGEVPGTVYGLSRKGWIEDGDLFDMWFARHFLSHVPPVHPLLNLMDGHSSHNLAAVIQSVEEEGVIGYQHIPHTYHSLLIMAVLGHWRWTGIRNVGHIRAPILHL